MDTTSRVVVGAPARCGRSLRAALRTSAAAVLVALAASCAAGSTADATDPAVEAEVFTTTTIAPLFELPDAPAEVSAAVRADGTTTTSFTATTAPTTTTTTTTAAPSLTTSRSAVLAALLPPSERLLGELGLSERALRADPEDQTVTDPLTGESERLWYARCPEPRHWCVELDLLTPADQPILEWIDEVRVSTGSEADQILVGVGPERRFDVFPSTVEVEEGLRASLAETYDLDPGVFEPRNDFAPLADFTRRAVREGSALSTVEDVAAWFDATEQPTFDGLRTEFRVRSIVRRDPAPADVAGWIDGDPETVVAVHLHAEAGPSGLDLLVAYTVLRTTGTLGPTS